MSLPGLASDAVVVKRPGDAVDEEGNPTAVLTTVSTAAGTWGSPTYRDLQRANHAGQQIEAVVAYDLAVAPDVRVGDQVTVRSKPHTVVVVGDTQLTRRVLLRRLEQAAAPASVVVSYPDSDLYPATDLYPADAA